MTHTAILRNQASHEGFHAFLDEEGNDHGSFEVFWDDHGSFEVFWDDESQETGKGWYWWACFPGCLPDGDSYGPFQTSECAYNDARFQQ